MDWHVFIKGTVYNAKTNEPITNASVCEVWKGVSFERLSTQTNDHGAFYLVRLAPTSRLFIIGAPGFAWKEVKLDLGPEKFQEVTIPLTPQGPGEDPVFFEAATGQQFSLKLYRYYVLNQILLRAPTKEKLREIWVDLEKQTAFMQDLRHASVHPELLAKGAELEKVDGYDLLAHIAFGAPLRTRTERVKAFLKRQRTFMSKYPEQARLVLRELLKKYEIGGIHQLKPEIFNVEPFYSWGGAFGIKNFFGGIPQLREALITLRERLYPLEEGVAKRRPV